MPPDIDIDLLFYVMLRSSMMPDAVRFFFRYFFSSFAVSIILPSPLTLIADYDACCH